MSYAVVAAGSLMRAKYLSEVDGFAGRWCANPVHLRPIKQSRASFQRRLPERLLWREAQPGASLQARAISGG